MKFAFVTGIITAIACAQEVTEEQQVPELNENGRYELELPEFNPPTIEFNQVDREAIAAWLESKEQLQDEWNAEFMEAWMSYTDQIAEPWNNFVTEAEDLIIEGNKLDAQTKEEVIQFIADNTFIDGKSLTEVVPGINDLLANIEHDAATLGERFNLDAFTITPRNLQSYYPEDYYYYDESSPLEDAMEEVGERVSEALVSYGFDPELVESWLEEKGASWDELAQRQNEEKAQMAQANAAEAADYLKKVVDNAVADIRSRLEENQEEFNAIIDERAAQLKAEADQSAQEAIDNIANWLNETYAEVKEATDSYEVEVADDVVVLASKPIKVKKAKKQAARGINYMAIGALSAGALATAYLYQKRQQKKSVEVDRTKLIDEDEEFVLV